MPSDVIIEKWKELWDATYGQLSLNKFIENILQVYIEAKNKNNEKIKLDYIYQDVIDRINGRLDNRTIMKILNKIARYDDIQDTFIVKQEKIDDIIQEITPLEEIKLPDPQEKFIPFLAMELLKNGYSVFVNEDYELSDVPSYLKRNLKRRHYAGFKEFPLVVEKEDKKVCIDINRTSLASQFLISQRAKVIVLYADDNIKKETVFLNEYIQRKDLILIDIRNL